MPSVLSVGLVLSGILLSPLPASESASGVPSSGGVDFEFVWRKQLGSGNSRVAVSDGKAVTLFSDGESDWLVALDQDSGDEIWRYRIASTYHGHDGSRDGPHASPTISDGVVYGFGPHGHLFAVRLDDGSEQWSLNTVEEIGALAPFWGFASTPLVVGPSLVLQATGEEGSIWAFDRQSGEVLWFNSHDRVGYQSPALMTLGNLRQIVAVTNQNLSGLDPRTGDTLWTYSLGNDDLDGSSEPVAVGENRFLLTSSATERRTAGRLFRATESGVEQVWESSALRASYAIPVVRDGALYGMRAGFLSCLDLATGKVLWRSREPGGYNLGRVAGHLLITGTGGNLYLARFSKKAYEEVARIRVFERGAPTAPTIVGTTIYWRNHSEIAAVRVISSGASASRGEKADSPRAEATGAIDRLLERLSLAENKAAVVNEFLAAQERFPIIEPNGVVHFIYRGAAKDVAIRGAMTAWGEAQALSRIPGTDLFYRTYKFDERGRWEYLFQVDFDEWVTDPLNPSTAVGEWREVSELRMPRWVGPSHLSASPLAEASFEAFELESEVLANARDVQVLLPPGPTSDEAGYPLLMVLDGSVVLERSSLASSLLELMNGTHRRFVAAFVSRAKSAYVSHQQGGGSAAYREFGGPDTGRHSRMLVEELIPELMRRFPIQAAERAVAVYGIGSAGLAALHAASRYPGVFGAAAVQSLRFGPTPMQSSSLRRRPVFDEVESALLSPDAERLRIYIDWASHDLRDPEQGIDLVRDNRDLYERLVASGHAVGGGEYPGGPGWISWRARAGEMLETLLPSE